MIGFLLAVVLIVVVGASLLAYRNRPQSSIESGIHSFRREMRALAPPPEPPEPGRDHPGQPIPPVAPPERREPPPTTGAE